MSFTNAGVVAEAKVGGLSVFHEGHGPGPSPRSSTLNLLSAAAELSGYERRLTAFNQNLNSKRPRPWPPGKISQSRASSWADPVSAREVLDAEGSEGGNRDGGEEQRAGSLSQRTGRESALGERVEGAEAVSEERVNDEGRSRRSLLGQGPKR
jgi:hypothetical protein